MLGPMIPVSLIDNLAAGGVLLAVGLVVLGGLLWALRPGGRAERGRGPDRDQR